MFVTLEVIREISTFSQVGLTRLVKMSTGHFFCLILSHGNLWLPPIPRDSHKSSNTKYIISCVCPMSSLYRAVAKTFFLVVT